MSERIARWLAELQDRWQSLPLPNTGQGEEMGVFSTLTWPVWIIVLVLIGAIAAVIYNYRNERGAAGRMLRGLLIALRVAAILVLYFMLEGWMLERYRTDLPDLVILLDVSASMATEDGIENASLRTEIVQRLAAAKLDGSSRLNLAKLALLEKDSSAIQQLREKYRLKIYFVGEGAIPVSVEEDNFTAAIRTAAPDVEVSRLGRGIRDVLEAQRGRPTSAIVFFTDGINTEGRSLADAAELARRKTIPLYFVGIGNDRPPRDARLADLLVDSEAFVNDLLQFDCKVSATGFAGKKLTIALRRKGNSAVLAEETITIDSANEIKPVRLQHRPNAVGDWEYEISIAGTQGDIQPENDRLEALVKVHDATVRVLLVQGTPSFEFRFLKTMLERDLNPNDQGPPGQRGFQVVLQDADVQFSETDKSALRHFPVSREELFAYDVILFGDANPSFFSQSMMQNIVDFVKDRGGSVVFIAGPRFNPIAYRDTPLASLMSIDPATVRIPDPNDDLTVELRPRVTRLGLTSPPLQLVDAPAENLKLWASELPGIYWWAETPDLRPGARVLMEHPTKTGSHGTPLPLVSFQFVGSGKTVFQAFDGSYRWRYRVGDRYFSRYWIQMIRYLSRSKVLGKDHSAELTSDRDEYRRGEPVLLRLKFLDDRRAPSDDEGVALMIERPGSPRRTVTVRRSGDARGVFEATLTNLAEGKYRAWLATPDLDGKAPAKEFRVVAPPGEQARLETDVAEMKAAAKTSLGQYAAWNEAGDLFERLPPGRQVRIESLPPQPLWNSPFLAALFVTLLITEWLIRKKVGML